MTKKKNTEIDKSIQSAETTSDANSSALTQPQVPDHILSLLLRDMTTGRNIIWAVDAYAHHGVLYGFHDEITIDQITGENTDMIKPRIEKSKKAQSGRTKELAEVFTPSWVVNYQINATDETFFNRKDVFNVLTADEHDWEPTDKVDFTGAAGNWMEYVQKTWLEITCGEFPYGCSRYDATTGEAIPLNKRPGVLDRKLRVVEENAVANTQWEIFAIAALKSVYGYEWQGDNLFLARQNAYLTFLDYYKAHYGKEPDDDYKEKLCDIICWNLFQMDGMKYVIPGSCHDESPFNDSLFDEEVKFVPCPGCEKNLKTQHNGIYVKVKDWAAHSRKTDENGKVIRFVDIKKPDHKKKTR